jgi:hypothetical protein
VKARAFKLTDDERRALVLPGDQSHAWFVANNTKPVATAPYCSLLTDVAPRGVVLLDAFAGGSIAITPVDEADTDAAAPEDVVFGCAVSAKLLRAAVAALPEGTVAVTWFGRYAPVALRSGDVVAFVMPRRCCGHAQTNGRFFDTAARVQRECPCRDCAAGRRWGW